MSIFGEWERGTSLVLWLLGAKGERDGMMQKKGGEEVELEAEKG